MSMFEEYKVDWPEEKVGRHEIKRIHLAKENIYDQGFRLAMSHRAIPPGTYTQLLRNKEVVMSDTPAEIRDLSELFYQVQARQAKTALVHGLGLGVVVRALLVRCGVERVDVVEREQEVIDLVGKHFDERVTIHHGDALTYKFPAGSMWDVAWHDIWTQ